MITPKLEDAGADFCSIEAQATDAAQSSANSPGIEAQVPDPSQLSTSALALSTAEDSRPASRQNLHSHSQYLPVALLMLVEHAG